MPIAAGGRGHVAPAVDVALAFFVAAQRQNRPVLAHSEGSSPSGGDGDDVAPAVDIALPVPVPSGCCDGAVGPKADGVRAACVGCGVNVSGCYGDDARPLVHGAFATAAISGGHGLSLRRASDGMPSACCEHCHGVPRFCMLVRLRDLLRTAGSSGPIGFRRLILSACLIDDTRFLPPPRRFSSKTTRVLTPMSGETSTMPSANSQG